MKPLSTLLLLCAILNGCSLLKGNFHYFNCPGKSRSQIIAQLSNMLGTAGMAVLQADSASGKVRGVTPTDWGSMSNPYDIRHYWSFQIIGDTIRASAYTEKKEKKAQFTTFSNHNIFPPGKKEQWYWSVRNALETWCGNTVIMN